MRIVLPDVPGSLGEVATAIGRAGANITALEILQSTHDGRVVDDLFVDMPTGVMPDGVVSQVNGVDGVRVLWISRYPASGNLYLDLEAIEMLTESPRQAVRRLVDLLPATFRCDWALVVDASSGSPVVRAATEGAPTAVDACADWFPLQGPATDETAGDRWPTWGSALVGMVPLGDPLQAVVFGRRGGPEILQSELVRLDYIATLAVSVQQAAG